MSKGNHKHGMTGTPEYMAYNDANKWCRKKGIKPRFSSFQQFYAELGEKPSPTYRLQRNDATNSYIWSPTRKGNYKHGMGGTPEYQAYCNARGRCKNTNIPNFRNYGGRGIDFLFDSFEQFYAELGPKPSPKHSIDRIDNEGHYQPGNVRWATMSEQNHNKRITKLDETKVVAIREAYTTGTVKQTELAKKYSVTKSSIHLIVRNKTWLPQEAA